MAWESAGKGRFAITDARIGVVLRPRVAAGFVRLSAACEAQGRYADAVRACYLVRGLLSGIGNILRRDHTYAILERTEPIQNTIRSELFDVV